MLLGLDLGVSKLMGRPSESSVALQAAVASGWGGVTVDLCD